MARIDTLANFLTDIANKIRSKTGSQSNITPANYDTEIENIKFNPNTDMFISFAIPIGAQQSTYHVSTTATSLNLKNIDTSKIRYMQFMFYNCMDLTSLDLSSFNTSSAISMFRMFQNCTNLTSLNLSSFDTSNVENMNSMFTGCFSLTSLDLSNFDTSKVSTFQGMLSNCTNLETITFGNNFTLDAATNLTRMFASDKKLDNNTLNAILHICTTVTSAYTGTKTLAQLGISDSFDNYANIPNLSNYQAFIDAGWSLS